MTTKKIRAWGLFGKGGLLKANADCYWIASQRKDIYMLNGIGELKVVPLEITFPKKSKR